MKSTTNMVRRDGGVVVVVEGGLVMGGVVSLKIKQIKVSNTSKKMESE